jgi:hypothetical protein
VKLPPQEADQPTSLIAAWWLLTGKSHRMVGRIRAFACYLIFKYRARRRDFIGTSS